MKFIALSLAASLFHQAEVLPKPQELIVEPPVDVRAALAGNTISAIAFFAHADPVKRQGTLNSASRLIFHAYLAEDGRASVRLWDEPGQRWQPASGQKWSVEGDKFCLSANGLALGLEQMCMETIVWHGVFSGTASAGSGDFMVKGNLLKGNPANL